jgi:LytS/YehU family sensor histidine kinase
MRKTIDKSLKAFHLLLILIALSMVLANVWFLETVLLDYILRLMDTQTIPFSFRAYLWELFAAMLLLVSWGAVYTFIKLYENWIEQKNQTARALLLAENANLKMLRYQLNPHFLFNSLGSLRALIRKDKDKAEEMLNSITDFLRYSLVVKADSEIPFREEFNATKNYFAIEKIRFGDKLKLHFHVDPAAEYFPVPSFILHPLVENAVKYGMITSHQALSITLRAEVVKDSLHIEITNSGHWYSSPDKKGTQNGLKNVKDRLQIHYPEQHTLEIEKTDEFVKINIELNRPLPL